MQKYLSFAFGFFLILATNADEKSDIYELVPSRLRPTYASGTTGDGYMKNSGNLHKETFEVRMGRQLCHSENCEGLRVDFLYLNEGHPPNYHRDGFGFQMVKRINGNGIIDLEVAGGPYYSMNTSGMGANEINDKRLGALLTFAVIAHLNKIHQGLELRAQYNHVEVPGRNSSDAFLVGVAQSFDAPLVKRDIEASESGWGVEILGGPSKTTHHDVAKIAPVSQFGFRKSVDSNISYSITYMDDGADFRTAREGIAGQLWVELPSNKVHTFSVGAGPFISKERRGDKPKTEVNGLLSIQTKSKITNNTSFIVRFTRVAAFRTNNDRDRFEIGISRALD